MIWRSAALVFLLAAAVSAQPATRRATNLAALLAHPAYYHLRSIVVVGSMTLEDNGEYRLRSDGASMRVLVKGSAPDGLGEVRGEFWDVGRMRADDPRLAGYDLPAVFKIDPAGAWPRPGEVITIVANTVTAAEQPSAPSIRNVVLHPSRYLDQKITVTGQFGGRNLLGDLPDAPAQSRWDFVVRSADAAVWVTNLRPRGRDFELTLDARIDTGRWIEVSGTLQQGRGLQWLDGSAGTVRLAEAPKDPSADAPIRIAPAPPPEVVFSAPIEGESDVALSASVRIQFSRDIDPSTFRGRIAIRYADGGAQAGVAEIPPTEYTTRYLPGTRVLEIRFVNPLERFRTVALQLLEGIVGSDKQPLAPWTLTFQTGP